jgi:hypothetical protein
MILQRGVREPDAGHTPLIDHVDPDRTASLRGIARALNDEGVPTPSGGGTWTAATVARLDTPSSLQRSTAAPAICRPLLRD